MKTGLNLKNICRYLMEEGYYPTYEKTHLIFNIDDNLAVLEYEEGIVSIRLFFSIDPEASEMFLNASNQMMMESFAVKATILEDGTNIMFSCEFICDTLNEFKRFFPKGHKMLREAVMIHKTEMKRLYLHAESQTIQTSADEFPGGLNIAKRHKILS